MIKAISTEDLVDPLQIGWIHYQEGDAVLSVKVIRTHKRSIFLSHVTAYRKGSTIKTVEYPDKQIWKMKESVLLRAFRQHVGEDYYKSGRVDSLPTRQRL